MILELSYLDEAVRSIQRSSIVNTAQAQAMLCTSTLEAPPDGELHTSQHLDQVALWKEYDTYITTTIAKGWQLRPGCHSNAETTVFSYSSLASGSINKSLTHRHVQPHVGLRDKLSERSGAELVVFVVADNCKDLGPILVLVSIQVMVFCTCEHTSQSWQEH